MRIMYDIVHICTYVGVGGRNGYLISVWELIEELTAN